MISSDPRTGWLTRERVLAFVLAIATLLAIYVCYLLVQPFLSAVVFAIALAVATDTPFRWIRKRVKRESVAAVASLILVMALLFVPAVLLANYVIQEGVAAIRAMNDDSGAGWKSLIERQPYLKSAADWMQRRFDVESQLRNIGMAAVGKATLILRGSLAVGTQLVITLFVLFFLYRDREEALARLRGLLPLSSSEAEGLLSRLAKTIRASVNGSLTVAAVQAGLAGVMYSILGVPGSVLWGAATFLAALVPVFGTVLIWGPVTIYLLLTGGWVKAAILVGWGVLAVGTIDNLLYPFLVGDKLRLHTVPTFFAVLGGLTVFGPVGLILGPVTLAVTMALLDIWWRRTAGGHAADGSTA